MIVVTPSDDVRLEHNSEGKFNDYEEVKERQEEYMTALMSHNPGLKPDDVMTEARHLNSVNDDSSSFSRFCRYTDTSMTATFDIDFPLFVSQVIVEHETSLKLLVIPLKDTYIFEAGYDILPDLYKLLILEQSDCFRGKRVRSLNIVVNFS